MSEANPKDLRRTLTLPLVALAIFLPVLVACGESGDSSGGSPAAPPAAPARGGAAGKDNDQIVKFTQCMRQNGVPQWPDPVDEKFRIRPGSVDPDSPQFKAAWQKCKSLRPLVVSVPPSPSSEVGQSFGRRTSRRTALGEGDGVIPDGRGLVVWTWCPLWPVSDPSQ